MIVAELVDFCGFAMRFTLVVLGVVVAAPVATWLVLDTVYTFGERRAKRDGALHNHP